MPDEEVVNHEIAVDMVKINGRDAAKLHGLKITLQKFSMDENVLAYVLLTPDVAEQVGMNLIRLAFLARVNDGNLPAGLNVSGI